MRLALGSILLYLVGILGGALAVTQGGSNVVLKKTLGGSLPPLWFSYLSGATAVAICSVVLRVQMPELAKFSAVPWWAWIGGVFGAGYVMIQLTLGDKLGASTMTGLLVTGQIIFSVILDNFGWLGFEQHPAKMGRLVGAAIMIVGLFLVAKF